MYIINFCIIDFFRTTMQSSYFSNDGFEFDTISLGISSLPPVGCSFSPAKSKHGETEHTPNLSVDEDERPISPRECWTHESLHLDC